MLCWYIPNKNKCLLYLIFIAEIYAKPPEIQLPPLILDGEIQILAVYKSIIIDVLYASLRWFVINDIMSQLSMILTTIFLF